LEFNEKELKPTYKFLSGVPGNSYAFVLAKNLGIQSTVIERANKYLGTRQSELEESISILQKIKTEAEELRRQAEQEKLKAEKARKDYELKFAEIKKKRQVLLDEAKQESYEIIKKGNALVENTIREIKEDKKSVSVIKKEYNDTKNELEKELRAIYGNKEEKPLEKIVLGDNVTNDDSDGSVGTVIEIDKEMALVDFNGIKFRFPISKLSKSGASPKPKKSNSDYITFDAKATLDIRGMRAGEALNLLDEFLSKALLANLQFTTIIHGKGTGALRQAVKEYLDNHHSIRSYRPGRIEEGGDGVTVVEV
jgi:DNA mismatch repair protein MutS2